MTPELTIDACAAALTDEWQKGIDVWRRMGCWSRVGVRNRLNDLFTAGKCERKSEPTPSGIVYLYRRKQGGVG